MSCAVEFVGPRGREENGAVRQGGRSGMSVVLAAALALSRDIGSPSVSTLPSLEFESSSLKSSPSRPRGLGRRPSDAMSSGGGGPR